LERQGGGREGKKKEIKERKKKEIKEGKKKE
jgi:hypothetical protein